jgi:3D (Asp-Asp-Asp) domain-containing protein
MGPRLRKILSGVLALFTVPTIVAVLLLLVGIIAVFMSILGVDMSLSSRKVMMLSMTTGPVIAAHIEFEKPKEPIPEPQEQLEQWEDVQMRVTAYCPCRICCGKFSDGVTACNHKIKSGDVFVAADKKYRFGTELIVPGYNNGEPVKVMDRGRVIKGDRLDVFFNSHRVAKKWGVQYLDVKIKK